MRRKRSGRTLEWWAVPALVALHVASGCGGTQRDGGVEDPEINGGASGEGPVGIGGKANPLPGGGRDGDGGSPDFPVGGGDGGLGGYPDFPIVGGSGGDAGSPNGPTGGYPSGDGGVGGYPEPPIIGGLPGSYGEGGRGDDGDPGGKLTDCDNCTVIAEEGQDVRAIVASDTEVFWIDHGTRDGFGNHLGDGHIFARQLAGGQPQIVGENLEGPVDLRISTQYAYITVDESSAVAGKGALSRVALGGGAAQLLESYHGGSDVPELPGHFAAGTGEVFLFVDDAISRIAETAGAEQSLFHAAAGVFEIFGDASFIYLYDAVGLHTLPHAGGQPALLQALETGTSGGPRYSHLTIADGFIYGQEDASNTSYLARMPKTGGPMKRVALLSGWAYGHVMVAGDRWVWDPSTTSYPYMRQIIQESFANPTVHHVLVTAHSSDVTGYGWGPMVLTSAGVFFENRGGITLAPLAP